MELCLLFTLLVMTGYYIINGKWGYFYIYQFL